MLNLILAIHIMACVLLIGLVLVQKSEGGGLGLGGGGGNSIFSARGAAGAIVRTTMIVGGIFLATSLGLTALAQRMSGQKSAVERALDAQNDPVTSLSTSPVPTVIVPEPSTGGLIDPSAAPSALPSTSSTSGSASVSIPVTDPPATPGAPPAEAPDANPPLQETPDTETPQ